MIKCQYCERTNRTHEIVRGLCNKHYKQVKKYGGAKEVPRGRTEKIECECGGEPTIPCPTGNPTKICKLCYSIEKTYRSKRHQSFREEVMQNARNIQRMPLVPKAA